MKFIKLEGHLWKIREFNNHYKKSLITSSNFNCSIAYHNPNCIFGSHFISI